MLTQLRYTLAAIMLIALLNVITLSALAAVSDKTFIVLTASWCASCREVIPITQEVATEHQGSVQLVDVDDPSAPSKVRSLGISDLGGDLPQIFLVRSGKAQLLLDGQSYSLGQTQRLRQLLNNAF